MLWLFDIQRIIDEHAYRLAQEAEEQPKRYISKLTIMQFQVLRKHFLNCNGWSLHQHRKESVVADNSKRNTNYVLVGDSWKDKDEEVSSKFRPTFLKKRSVAMSHKEIVHGQVPGLPIFFKISAVPPIHVKVSITKLNYFWYDVEEKVEKCVKSHNPANSIRDWKFHQPICNLQPFSFSRICQRKPSFQLWLHVLHPEN